MAGAISMAAGEYVSVNSQSDAERVDLARERKELHENDDLGRFGLGSNHRNRENFCRSCLSIESTAGSLAGS